MKKLDTVVSRRKAMKITQAQLSKTTGINRGLLSRLESLDYIPAIEQLQALGEALNFEPTDMFVDTATSTPIIVERPYKIAVAGTGYVGLSLAVLLAQHNKVTAVDIVPEKVEKLNSFISPIQDEYIEKYLDEAKKGKRNLDLTATTDGAAAYADADFIIIAAPTNYDPKQNFFDCSAVESVLALIKESTADRETKPTVIIKSTIPSQQSSSSPQSLSDTPYISEKKWAWTIFSSVRSSFGSPRRSMTTCIPAGLLSGAMIKQKVQLAPSQAYFSKERSRIRSKPCSWDTPRLKPQSCS